MSGNESYEIKFDISLQGICYVRAIKNGNAKYLIRKIFNKGFIY